MVSPNMYYAQAGIGNAASYLVSGRPWLTGGVLLSSSFAVNNAERRITFPKVTRSITVINTTGSAIRVHFNSVTASVGNVISGRHYTTLRNQGDSITYNMKCSEIYVSLVTGTANGDFEMAVELTTIPISEITGAWSGSGITD